MTFDLGLHCLPIIFLGVSRVKWANLVLYLNCCNNNESGRQESTKLEEFKNEIVIFC